MKAIFFEKHGGIEVLKYGDLPDPKPGPGQALVRVRAVALNHLDIWVRRGWKGLHLNFPHITGSDIAGDVVSVHAESNWNTGDPVVINPGIKTKEDEWTKRGLDSVSPGYRIIGEHFPGGLAEFVVVPVGNLFRIPDGLTYEEAAAPLLVGMTCWRMLFTRGGLKPGETVLIVGSGGGVNSLAIAFAKAAGAKVYALTSTPEKAQRAQELGAAHVVNYLETPKWHIEILRLTKGRGVDVVVDNVGHATYSKSLRAVARGGRILTVGNTSGHEVVFDNRFLFAKQVSIIGSTMGSTQDFLDAMSFLIEHEIKPIIDSVQPLSNGIELIQRLEEGKQFGKIILTP